MTEEILDKSAKEITRKIKISLFEKDMKQVDLAKLINENPTQLNRAIHGDMTPKSISIRQSIYKILDIN